MCCCCCCSCCCLLLLLLLFAIVVFVVVVVVANRNGSKMAWALSSMTILSSNFVILQVNLKFFLIIPWYCI